MQAIREYRSIDVATFHDDIVPSARPAVLRNLIDEWPAVQHGAHTSDALLAYLRSLDAGADVQLVIAPPAARGRLFYDDAMTGLGFERQTLRFATALDRIAATRTQLDPPALAIQSAPLAT